MIINKSTVLDIIDTDLLYRWGCPSYEMTLKRLVRLRGITVDPEIKEKINDLRRKLILHTDEEHYGAFYAKIRRDSEANFHNKLNFAKVLAEAELRVTDTVKS